MKITDGSLVKISGGS